MEKVTQTFYRVLNFLNLLDSGHRLSITNAVVIIFAVEVAFVSADLTSISALMLALLNYSHKRQVISKAPVVAPTQHLVEKLDDLNSRVAALAISQGEVR